MLMPKSATTLEPSKLTGKHDILWINYFMHFMQHLFLIHLQYNAKLTLKLLVVTHVKIQNAL